MMRFAFEMARRAPQATLDDCVALIRLARALHREAERACSARDEDELERLARRADELEARAAQILARVGIRPRFGRDPRGAPILLELGGLTVAVPF